MIFLILSILAVKPVGCPNPECDSSLCLKEKIVLVRGEEENDGYRQTVKNLKLSVVLNIKKTNPDIIGYKMYLMNDQSRFEYHDTIYFDPNAKRADCLFELSDRMRSIYGNQIPAFFYVYLVPIFKKDVFQLNSYVFLEYNEVKPDEVNEIPPEDPSVIDED